jgi:hypothetical protein
VDFARVLKRIAGYLEGQKQPWALVGGLGMAAYGMQRTTLDIDLVVPGEIQDSLVGFLETEGYETIYRSTGYSNHVHDDPMMGRVDIVYVRGETAVQVFRAPRSVAGPGGVKVAVPRPEHLAAMKVFAMKNDPARTLRELADIRFLLELPDTDPEEVRRYFEKHGMGDRFDEIA